MRLAILMVTVQATIITSACRGVADAAQSGRGRGAHCGHHFNSTASKTKVIGQSGDSRAQLKSLVIESSSSALR